MGLTWAKKPPTVKSTRVEENAIFHSGGKSRVEQGSRNSTFKLFDKKK